MIKINSKKILMICTSVYFAMSGTEVQASRFSRDVAYPVAVKELLNTLEQDVNDAQVVDEQEFSQWHGGAGTRLPELMDDLTEAIIEFEGRAFGEYNVDEFVAISQKWNDIILQYPNLAEVEAVVNPILEEFLDGLPVMRSAKDTDIVPLQNVYEYHNEVQNVMLWGLQALFRILPIEREEKQTFFDEISKERTVQGYEKINIIRREKRVLKNGDPHFYELIEDDQLIDRIVAPRDATLVHEILRRMKEDDRDFVIISYLEWLAAEIDLHLNDAWQNGFLNDETYRYIYGYQPQEYFDMYYPEGILDIDPEEFINMLNDVKAGSAKTSFEEEQGSSRVIGAVENEQKLVNFAKADRIYDKLPQEALSREDRLFADEIRASYVFAESKSGDNDKSKAVEARSFGIDDIALNWFLFLFSIFLLLLCKEIVRVVKMAISGTQNIFALNKARASYEK